MCVCLCSPGGVSVQPWRWVCATPEECLCVCVCVYVCGGMLFNANLHCRTVLSVAWFRQVLLVVIFGPRAQGIDGSCNREPAVHHEHVSKFLFFKKESGVQRR